MLERAAWLGISVIINNEMAKLVCHDDRVYQKCRAYLVYRNSIFVVYVGLRTLRSQGHRSASVEDVTYDLYGIQFKYAVSHNTCIGTVSLSADLHYR